ncbi:MAG: hypothetical protein LXA50_03495 [Betaproteobacteria bacterium]|nr:hypothetical protein [Betaproteobacteria bacterium]
MIIEIALGIVLAVVILAFLPAILAIAVGGAAIAIVAVLAIAVVLLAWENTEAVGALLLFFCGLVGLIALAGWIIRRWPHMALDSTIFWLVLLGFVLLCNHFALFGDWDGPSGAYAWVVAVTVLVDALLLYLFHISNRSQLAEWRRQEAIRASYLDADDDVDARPPN